MKRDVEDEVYQAVEKIPNAAVKCKIYTVGFILASALKNRYSAWYFFDGLRIISRAAFGDIALEARNLCAKELGRYEDLEFSTEFFLDLIPGASMVTIGKIYNWCFFSGALDDYIPYVPALFPKTRTYAGIDTVFKYVMMIGDNKWAYSRVPISSLYFYIQLLGWMNMENVRMHPDVADLVKDYIETMEHESQIVDSQYLKSLSAGEMRNFNNGLSGLKNMLEGISPIDDSSSSETRFRAKRRGVYVH